MRSDEQITLQGRVEEKCTCQDPDHTPVTQLSSQMDSTGQEMTSHAGNKRRKHLIKANHCENTQLWRNLRKWSLLCQRWSQSDRSCGWKRTGLAHELALGGLSL